MKRRFTSPSGHFARLFTASALILPLSPVIAVTWDNSLNTGAWSAPDNWDTNMEPNSADDVVFPFGLAGAITTTNTEQALSLTFNDDYTLSGGTLALASGNSITVASGVTATIGNSLNITGGTIKLGDGVLELNASNTNTTGTTISSGTLRVGHVSALGSSASLTTVSGGTLLQIKGGITLDRQISLLQGGTLAGTGGTATNNGKITIDAGAATVSFATDDANDLFLVGNGTNDLTGGSPSTVIDISGPGTIRLGGASDFPGSWNLPTGVLELGNATALGNQNTSGITLSGGILSARLNSATNFAASSPANNITVTADSGLRSDRTSAGTGVIHTFGALSIGSHTLSLAPGLNPTAGTAGITLGDVTISGNPIFAVDDNGAANGKLTTGSLIGGVARTLIKTGTGDFAATGGSTDLPAGSTFTASGGGTIEMIFPALGAGTPVAVSAAENPFGEATLSITDGGLTFLANGSGTSAAQTYQIASTISLSGTVTLDANRISGSNANKTFELPGLTLAAGTELSMAGDNTHGVALTGPLALLGDATLKGVDVSGKDGRLTLDGGISGAGGDALTINGGTSPLNLTINASGTYGGGTEMNASNVTLNAANAFGTGTTVLNGGSLTVNTDAALAGTVTVNGGTLRVNSPTGLAANAILLDGGALDFRNNDTTSIATGGITISGTSAISVGNNGSGSSKVLDFPLLNISGNTELTVSTVSSFIPYFTSIALTGDLTLNQTGTARIESISEDASPRSFIKTGTGTVEMKAASTHSGGTEVLAGVLLVEHGNALGSGSLVLGDTSGTASATARFNSGLTIPNNIIARAGSSGTVTLDAVSGGVTWTGGVNLQRDLALDNGNANYSSLLSGQITGTGGLSKISSGEFILGNASNTFGSGATDSVTITDGVLTVIADGALGNVANGVTLAGTDGLLRIDGSFASARIFTFTGSSTGIGVTAGNEFTVNTPLAGAGTFLKTDSGILTLAAGMDSSLTRASATTSVTGGTLRIQSVKSLSDAGPILMNTGSGTIEFLNDSNTNFAHPLTVNTTGICTIHVDRAPGGSATNGRHTLGDVSTTSGDLAVTGANGYGLSIGTLTTTANPTITNDASGVLEIAAIAGESGNSTRTLNVGGASDTHVTGSMIQGPGTGAYRITKTGEGTFRFGTSISGFGNIVTVRDGTLDLNGLDFTAESLVFGGGPSVGGAEVTTGGGTLFLTGGLSFSTGSPAPEGASITGATDLDGLPQTFVVNNSTGAAVDVDVNGPIGGAGGSSITKTGAGTLRFSGAGNTQPGLVTVSAGSLELGKSSGDAIGTGGMLVSNATIELVAANQINDAATVTLSGLNDTLLEMNGFTDTLGPIEITQTDAFDYTAIRTGATGTLVLGGNLVFNNNTNNGFTDERNVLITGSGDEFTASTDGTLDLGGAVRTIHVDTTTVGTNEPNANATIETQIINGGILKTGPRALYLSNPNNTFAGGLQITGGTVIPGGAGSLGLGPVTFGNTGSTTATLDLGTLTGTVAGNFTIGGSGSGESILTYSGQKPSLLELSGNFALDRDLTINVVNGTTTRNDSAVLHLSGLIDDGPATHGLVKIGDGAVRLAAGNTYTGGISILRGIVEIPAESALGDSTTALTINGGCLNPTTSFTLTRDIAFGANSGNIRVDPGNTFELAGNIVWGNNTSAFHNSGTTVLSGTTSADAGDLWLGAATEFAVVAYNESLGLGHVLSLRNSASLPSGNLRIVNNAVLELGNGDFTRPLGTGPGEVQLDSSKGGGWAAFGANRTVNLGGASASVVWGEGWFLYEDVSGNDVGALVLGSSTATHTVDFQNPLDLDTSESFVQRTVTTNDGPAALDAKISGDITQTPNINTFYTSLTFGGDGTVEVSGPVNGPLILLKKDPGTAILSGTNSFDGGVDIFNGTLVSATNASLPPQPSISVSQGAVLDASAMTIPVTTETSAGNFHVYGTLIGDVEVQPAFYGNGTVDGNLQALAGSYVYPDYNGSLQITGDFTLDVGASFRVAFSGPVPEQDHTVIHVTGLVDLAGYLDMNVFDVPPLPAGPYVLIYNDGNDAVNGTFDGVPEGATYPLGGGLAMEVTYLANADGGAVGNDVAVTFVADATVSDMAVTPSAPLIVDLGAPITISYEIDNLGPADVTDGNLQIQLPGNASFVSSTPAGSLSLDILSIPLPALTANSSTTVQLDLTAPAISSSVFVDATVGNGNPDPVYSNNYARSVTAVLPDACLQLSDYSTDLVAGTVSLSIFTQSDVTYMFQSSIDLVHWEDGPVISGYDYTYEATEDIDETREFFRFIIIPYDNSGGGGVEE